MLYRFYAKVLDGGRDQANEQIDRALGESRGIRREPSE